MNTVIYLNGPSSAGKTSISLQLQDILPENFLHIGIDTLIAMMPQRTNNFQTTAERTGFCWQRQDLPDGKQGMRITSGEYGRQINTSFHRVVASLLETGHHLIIDDVADGHKEVAIWERELAHCALIKVGVFCDLSVLQEREKIRGDRMQGSAAEQFYRVHQGVTYDLCLQTDSLSSAQCAKRIENHLAKLSA